MHSLAFNRQYWLATPHFEPKQPSLPVSPINPLQGENTILHTHVHAGQVGADHGAFTAKPTGCYVHSTLWVTPLSAYVLPFMLMQNLRTAQYDVTKSAIG